MKYKIKNFIKADISKSYMVLVTLICLVLIGSYFSYAMFTVSKEKGNAISIVTGNLTYKLTVDGTDGNKLTVGAGETKEFTVTLSNPNNRTARFNFYYVGSLPSGVEAGYKTGDGINTPMAAVGSNLNASGSAGHTGLVTAVNEDGTIETLESGANDYMNGFSYPYSRTFTLSPEEYSGDVKFVSVGDYLK